MIDLKPKGPGANALTRGSKAHQPQPFGCLSSLDGTGSPMARGVAANLMEV